jgi:cysteinyl-tRNA synthetase
MTIRLHNSKSRRKEDFTPLDASNVRMYVCGPTVYDRAHLGNGRAVVVFDVLYRLLRHVYGPDHVTYVRNFTDVDDKINDEALRRQKAGAAGTLEALIRERTEETIAWYHADMDALGALRPDHEPRATEYIAEMKEMIAELVEKKNAYAVPATIGHNSRAQYVYLDNGTAPSHAFLSVDSFEQRQSGYHYGDLSGRSVDDMVSGSRSEIGEGKRNPMDSVLWKPSTIEQPGWNSPWGFGRPGWHIECSAMSRKLLGKRFDIHGGGLDLLFPHHENELAQCTACDGADASASYWMHNEMLQVEGKKMSKSLGNFFTVRDLLDQGVPGEVIRFVLLGTHYRSPMDWTESRARDARRTLVDWYTKTDGVEADWSMIGYIERALSEDLNTHAALSELAMWSDSEADHSAGTLKAGMLLMGFPPAEDVNWFRKRQSQIPGIVYNGLESPAFEIINVHMRRWAKLRDERRYAEADEIRTIFESAGVRVSVQAGVPFADVGHDFDPSKLEQLE